jgi:hypothetical protein
MRTKKLSHSCVVPDGVRKFPEWPRISGTFLEPLIAEVLAKISIVPAPHPRPTPTVRELSGHRILCPAELTRLGKDVDRWMADIRPGQPNLMLERLRLQFALQHLARTLNRNEKQILHPLINSIAN